LIKVTYFYSACVGIETKELSILCDPWFTEGAYDGAWYHYPPFDSSQLLAKKFDFIYVSHIHPDHYDPVFLRDYLKLNSGSRVVIAPFAPNYLSKKMAADGIPHSVCSEFGEGATRCAIFLNPRDPADIDSALVVKREAHTVVNMNDNLLCESQIQQILDFCRGSVDIALLGYTGAGPFPQTYYKEEATLERLARAKKEQFFERYRSMKAALNPKKVVPFAGKYVLGGRLAPLNKFRGVADAVEVCAFDENAVVLADGGRACIDTVDLTGSELRKDCYDAKAMDEYIKKITDQKMDYEKYFAIPVDRLPLLRLLPKAYKNALKKSAVDEDHYFAIRLAEGSYFVMNANPSSEMSTMVNDPTKFEPRSEIEIEPAYLFGLISGIFHWNNAEVGSQYFTHRIPDIHNRKVQAYLNFFHL
jgi:UDP-MurNAc hydroxylase